MDITAWLRDLGLEHYEQSFHENEIDADILPTLTVEDLKDLGVTVIGHRRKLLNAIAALRDQSPSQSDLAVTSAPAADAGVNAGAPVPDAERRQVATLFADLAGYTQLSRELDAEEVHALLGRFYALVDGTVKRYGGSIDKHIGDCVMAVFGAPVAHGNDPERAVRSALEMQSSISTLRDGSDRPVSVHIGIASGQVVASSTGSSEHLEYTVTGRLGESCLAPGRRGAGGRNAYIGRNQAGACRPPGLHRSRSTVGQRVCSRGQSMAAARLARND